ncbi:SNF domain containing protein, partial [Asbolus verrucosus]
PGLVFQVYPEAVATLPGSHFWSMLFFFMLIMLGLDSAMGGLECVITGLMDEFTTFFKTRRHSREIFTLGVIIVSFSIALINVTPGGIYMFHLFDTYSAGISLLCSALFEAIAVSWFYGLDRFTQDVEAMIGSKPGLYWRICWKFISPTFIIMVVMFGLLNPQPLQYNGYFYPIWAEWVGWSLALSSIIMIPLVAVLQLVKTEGTIKEKIAISITPIEEHEEIRRSKLVSRFRAKHWLFV